MVMNDDRTSKATKVTVVVVALAASAYWWLAASGVMAGKVNESLGPVHVRTDGEVAMPRRTTYIAVAGMVQRLGIT